ncbi:NADPH-dependent FMN reductase [Pseudonocardia spinosispora]|uniref:NADPH-dependent FMN reductase n=1 Tax=Pseudonocardia spinosispora TaxID=103441 RepID=UPI00041F41D9|nr:NAD(P)H-dependent oxidoreductase [Pseudonocardia spinosispora]
MSTERKIRLAVIIGSTREGRSGTAIARWFVTHAQPHPAFDLDVVDLAELPLPNPMPAEATPEQQDWVARVDRADAYVVITPDYNHSFPASLKHAIDFPYQEWAAKPVGFVSYGGVARGLRAVEQLRLVFAEVHAMTVRDGVSISVNDGLDEAGWVRDPAAVGAVKTMLDQLGWWARALRTARVVHPYGS